MINGQPSPSAEPMIKMQDVAKWYGSFQALHDINMSVTQGERIVLCGPPAAANPR